MLSDQKNTDKFCASCEYVVPLNKESFNFSQVEKRHDYILNVIEEIFNCKGYANRDRYVSLTSNPKGFIDYFRDKHYPIEDHRPYNIPDDVVLKENDPPIIIGSHYPVLWLFKEFEDELLSAKKRKDAENLLEQQEYANSKEKKIYDIEIAIRMVKDSLTKSDLKRIKEALLR